MKKKRRRLNIKDLMCLLNDFECEHPDWNWENITVYSNSICEHDFLFFKNSNNIVIHVIALS